MAIITEREKDADVVVIGLGAAGGVAVLPLAQAGLEVVALEAGGHFSIRDYHPDEIRNDIRNWLGRAKVNDEIPTQRATPAAATTPAVGASRMMNGVGGTSIHWGAQSWRLMPWNFRERSETIRRYGASAIPAGSTITDWPISYEDLEPYYDKVEYLFGVSGKAGNVNGTIDARGNVFEGPRARDYPLPPLRRSGFTELMANAARQLGWHPFAGPAAIRSQEYDGLGACAYHGFCTFHGCHVDAKGSTNLSPIPKALKTGNLKVVEHARATEVVVGRDGRVTGVRFLKGGELHFQPAKAVLVAGYTYENTRLLLLSKSAAFPNGLSNNHGQVGKHYLAHTRAGANGIIPRKLNRFSGSAGQWTALDDWDSDFFDHTGLGFIGGGTMSATMEVKPIAAAKTTPPSLPRWGSAWKAWLKDNAISVASTATQINTTPYETNFLDLDPTTKDPQGIPVVRVTNELKPMERAAAAFVAEKCRQWLVEAGATETWLVAPNSLSIQTHAFGGTRMGNSPSENVTDAWCFSHEVPNLGVLGASNFPTSGGRNPTETLMALAWRSADHLVASWSDRTG
jgi:gluconate 2-dehydrogenase alpha chain